MINKPLISVIMPVYNCEKTVAVAIDSILSQTYENIELIVVDDASTDQTKKIVAEFLTKDARVKFFENETDPERYDQRLKRNINAGYSARNLGFKHSKGELITFQDADDASLLNRLEVQQSLLAKYGSTHLTLDWFRFDESKIGKKLDTRSFFENPKFLGPKDLYRMARRSRGLVSKISTSINRFIPFHLKRKRVINKLFFGSLENYPGAGNSPLFKREVLDQVVFRKLRDRIWPSFMGRGADKDFNFQVAETFRNSHVFFVPLYMWRIENQNGKYADAKLEFIS